MNGLTKPQHDKFDFNFMSLCSFLSNTHIWKYEWNRHDVHILRGKISANDIKYFSI